jgi:very-short-patch-repair endonuclease
MHRVNPEPHTHTLNPLPFAQDLERFREKLLDLSKRNALLNYRKSARTVQIVDELPNQIFERLVLQKKQFRFQAAIQPETESLSSFSGDTAASGDSLPDPARERTTGDYLADGEGPHDGEPSPAHARRRTQRGRVNPKLSIELPEPASAGDRIPNRHEDDILQTNLADVEKLESQLKAIAQRARSAIEETGVNYLYLALGSLLWTDGDSINKPHTAPLLLIPVLLERVFDQRSCRYSYKLEWTGEEIQHNLSLERKLERDFALKLPHFDENSSTTEDYFRAVRHAVQSRVSWQVFREAFLGFFSFHKLMMYLDADPKNWNGKTESDMTLANAILCGSETPFAGTALYAGEYRLDEESKAQKIPLIFDADSSQHSALCDIADGKSIVIEGPPGTGKSQTITNAIAAAMYQGKSVLFVAEKLAALEVVQKKLEAAGLGDFCLAIHSDDATPTRVLESIRLRMDHQFPVPHQMESLQDQLDRSREVLNEYLRLQSAAIGPNGETLNQLQWKVAKARLEEVPGLEDPKVVPTPTAIEFQSNVSQLRTFERMIQELKEPRESPWWGFLADRVLPNEQDSILSTLRQMRQSAGNLRDTLARTAKNFGGDSQYWFDFGLKARTNLTQLNASLQAASHVTNWAPLQGAEQRKLAEDLVERVLSVRQLQQTVEQLPVTSVPFTEHQLAFVTDYVARFLLNPLGHYAMEQVRSLVANLRDMASDLEAAREVSVELGNMGFGSISSLAAFQRIHQILTLAQDPVLGDEPHFSSELYHSDATQIVESARSEAQNFVKDQRMIEVSFYSESIPTGPEILALEKRLRPHNGSLLRWFSSDFRSARRELFVFARRELGNDVSVWLRSLETLRTLRERKDAFENSPRWKDMFGKRFQGLSTPWDRLQNFAVWLEKLKLLVLDYENARKSVQRARSLLPQRQTCDEILKRNPMDRISAREWTALDLTAEALRNANFSELEKWAVGMASSLELVDRVLSVFATAHTDSISQLSSRLETFQAWQKSRSHLASAPRWESLGSWFQGPDTPVADLQAALELLRRFESIGIPRGLDALWAMGRSPVESGRLFCESLRELVEEHSRWQVERQHLEKHGDLSAGWLQLETQLDNDPGCVQHLENLLTQAEDFPQWCLFSHSVSSCTRNRLKPFLDLALTGAIAPGHIAAAYERVVYENAISQFIHEQPALRHFSRQRHEETRASFQHLDRQLIQLNRHRIAYELSKRQPPPGNARGKISEYTEMGLIRHEIQKQKRHCRIRELLRRAGTSVQALKPCLMMSPLSVAQYIPPEGIQFDIVIMDEASQIKPEDALGTVMRARQLVVVGDPKQMPPSSTFERQDDEVNEEDAIQMDNTESILEVTSKTFQPLRRLRWHYRSKHEHLIQFSNERFYDGDLIVFPSFGSDSGRLGLFLHEIENGFFQNGQNRAEAEKIVEAIIAHATEHPEESLGVGALNIHQMRLISDLLDKRCEQDPVARAARDQLEQKQKFEKLFIKNLENLQGDERDVIFISYTYGKDPASGKVFKRFGPMAQDVGWRRFNVLITRARKRLEVFSSISPLDIGGGPDKSRGVNAMRDFLEFCRTRQIPDRQIHTGRPADSDFEVSVGKILSEMGVRYVPQVGVAGFFIDLGVLHPESHQDFVLGIECDGASYHSSKSARDRDRLRQEIIESRGWKIHRIWSTDWFQNQKFEIERLRQVVNSSMEPLSDTFQEPDVP